jgi:ribonucleoside-diphosphate reductase alpha chain
MSQERPQDSVAARLSPNALEVLRRRYLRRGPDGKPAETVEEMFRRVARHIAAVEAAWNGDVHAAEEIFYDLLTSLRFVPNSPTFTGAGTPLGQLAACFVLPVSDDMGRRDDGIFQTLRNMALIHQTGGGTGFSFSRLRPKDTIVLSSGGKATGPVGFMRVYDLACEIVSQGGTRRGANMGVLRVDHPDIEEFITCKTDEHAINNFNISVGVTDAFMRAVENDEEWELRFPDVLHPAYRTFNGTLEEAGRVGIPIQVYRKVRARDLFDKIVRQAHRNGEPGILFLDAMNRANPCPHLGDYEATNPCLAGDTWVVTDRGPAQVKQLIGVPVSLLVNGRFHPTSAEGFFCTGKRETLEIRTRRGFRLTVTPEHPLRVVTRMTRYTVESAWRRAGDLKIGDRVLLGEHRDATWAGRGTWEEGYLLGLLVGDGTFADSRAVISVWGEGPGPEAIRQKVESILSHFPHRADFQGFARIPERGEYRLRSRALYDLARAYGLSGESKGITPEIEQTSSDFHVGFLCGLFDTDGTVLGSQRKGLSIRLAQSDLSMLEAVQRMLHRLGIVSTIYQNRRKGRTSLLPDGRGGVRLYPVRPQHELVISGENLAWFAQRVGFVHEEKAARLRQGLEAYRRRMNRERFVDEVVAIEPRGENRVYDARVPGIHAFDANGFYVHNCGEQPLLPYENCCLGSINLARHVAVAQDSSCHIDWDLLQKTVEQAVRFLDDVVDANAYVPAIPQLKEAAQRTRRIGLGIMALGDVMYMLGVRYGSEEAQELASQIMEFIRYHAMRASIALARERGPFPAIRGSVYDPEDLRWTPPTPLVPYTRLEKWGRPPLDWGEILDGIRQYGIRNAAQLTVAPTGTIATIAGCEAYGCEPVYALAYTRKVHDEGREIELRYVSPLFLQALERAGIDEPTREKILGQVLFTGSCQDVPEVPPEIRHVFVVAGDITAEEHVRMQAALQAFVDAAISKTINFPADATPEDVARAYMLAWKLGCKGLTVYVTGSREKVVLETEAVRKAREARAGAPGGPSPTAPPLTPVRPRPHVLQGQTYRITTPLGTAYVTVNCNGEGEPFEVFLNVGKAGSDTAAVAEAIGRLISLILRVPSPLPARRRLQQVVKQLRGIGGGRPTGFGRDRVQSLPDGVAQVLAEFLGLEAPPEQPAPAQLPLFPLGDLCPECGHATLVSEEGCRRCYTCGYSEC